MRDHRRPVFERTGVHSRAGELAADMKVLANRGEDGVAQGALSLLGRRNSDSEKLEPVLPLPWI